MCGAAITLGAARPDLVSGIVLIDIGHRLEEEGVRRIIGFMRAHDSFASLEDAATSIAAYLPHRKEVRPESLSRNLRQRADGRWVWKHGLARAWRADDVEADDLPDWRGILEGLADDAAALSCPVLVLRGSDSDVLSNQGAEEVAALIPDSRLRTVANAGHLAAVDHGEAAAPPEGDVVARNAVVGVQRRSSHERFPEYRASPAGPSTRPQAAS